QVKVSSYQCRRRKTARRRRFHSRGSPRLTLPEPPRLKTKQSALGTGGAAGAQQARHFLERVPPPSPRVDPLIATLADQAKHAPHVGQSQFCGFAHEKGATPLFRGIAVPATIENHILADSGRSATASS